jgi:hypothetical protein
MKVIRVVEDMSGSGVIMIRLFDVIRMKDVQDQPVGRYDRRKTVMEGVTILVGRCIGNIKVRPSLNLPRIR